MQEALFYSFSLERHVPNSHLFRKIDRLVDLTGLWAHRERYYSHIGRPSIAAEQARRVLERVFVWGFESVEQLDKATALQVGKSRQRRLKRDFADCREPPARSR